MNIIKQSPKPVQRQRTLPQLTPASMRPRNPEVRPTVNIRKFDLLTFQAAAVRFDTPSRAGLRLSLRPAADGSPIYFATDKAHTLTWVEATDKMGCLHTVAGTYQRARKRLGVPDVLEYSLTFAEAGRTFLRTSVSAMPMKRIVGFGIGSVSANKSRSSIAITSSFGKEGLIFRASLKIAGVAKNKKCVVRYDATDKDKLSDCTPKILQKFFENLHISSAFTQ
jgi:hypothetical protein